MSPAQVKQAEEIARTMIAKNEEVFAKDSALPLAKAVLGLRAVFDETYPDPVRIVSIGVPVDDLLNNPNSPAGMNTSVEFCGGTHLKRSGHIGDFVITTEEAIAKGIRRIVCVTGPEATRAVARCTELEKLTKELKIVIDAAKDSLSKCYKDFVKKIVELQDALSASDISYWKKDELRNDLNALKKLMGDHERSIKAAQANEVVTVAKQLATDHSGDQIMVKELSCGSNAKALDTAIKAYIKIAPSTSTMFFSVDDEAGKVICLSAVPKDAVAKGLKANEWVNHVAGVINGRGGGKPESAQATGSNIENVNDAVKLSQEFAQLKLQ